MEIVYDDNHLIIVNKSAGELVQGDRTGDPTLIDSVKAWIKEKYQKPGNVFLGVTHRIDRPTCGLVVMAKTSKGLSRMNELFRKGEVHKTYWAVVGNKPPKDEDTLTHYLKSVESNNKTRRRQPALLATRGGIDHRAQAPDQGAAVSHRMPHKRGPQVWRATQQP